MTSTSSTAGTGTCWFCGARPGTASSRACPFYAQTDGAPMVLVIPRCDACLAFHERTMTPSVYVILGCAIVAGLAASLLPFAGGLQKAATMGGLVAGVATGIVLTAGRERRAAARQGTRPAHDALTHERYRTLAADTATWRQYRGAVRETGGAFRRDTVGDYALAFANDAAGLEALRRGCADAGIDPPSRVS